MSTENSNKTGIIILAAGNSSRLGRPKQLLEFKKSFLLQNTISEAVSVTNSNVIVVLGSNKDAIQKEIDLSQTTVVFNQDWELGMSTSIVCGLQKLLEQHPECQRCIIAVCDQPFVTAKVFEDLINEHQKTEKGIAAASYAETIGTPVLFHQKYFDILLEIKGQQGAKKIINSFLEDTAAVVFEKGKIDIDTPEDYKKLLS
ncbi:nucleotidyltransferase family protein [Flavobacterium reichenbachii]|uniref:Molybdopterin-guanine dinucleotide biosynthesis protein MobA n=1 Tax=Flavobacterium reichenbachii TaxID=362418 RepID=A0A085ZG71_9FLAO|nr:nucleotidyltransferase family protein [Flavobacterium reichenbachii]KFF03435.1 molybdopterin-guanine dinucleotide biosynthesis protein MobA [Flavobacterium reichenbachii]